ncbi:hypothetical protein KsCSTR_09690 [Candidatus Kuenenia stuttgartiensis]|uniref:Uncharacterized protein n=1 Tax=Kuenenia stuttgartiensis TaxID=174633 RepID=Q1PYX2_KUEST|nr:hypothetical protein KsCSTR_09690 [Candidatus Kuenenia stuttgartiensis]CAJ72288.1 unknown protein [Candidatus Kuenenia stuttgartiensis]
MRYKQTAPKGATLFFISPWIFQITKVLRIILLKTTPFSPFIKGNFSGRLLNLMTLGYKPEPAGSRVMFTLNSYNYPA